MRTKLIESTALLFELLGQELESMEAECPEITGTEDLSLADRNQLLVTCSAELIAHVLASQASYNGDKARDGLIALTMDMTRRLDELCQQ